MHRIMEAARKGDPRARQMLTRLRNAIDEVLGGNKKAKKMKKRAPAAFGFKTSKANTNAYGAFKIEADQLRVRIAEMESLKQHAAAQRSRVDRLNKSNAVRAMKMREAEVVAKKAAMAKKMRAIAASKKIEALRAEMRRVEAELKRLKRELGRSK